MGVLDDRDRAGILDPDINYVVPRSVQGSWIWMKANGYSLKVIALPNGEVTVRAWKVGEEDSDTPIDTMVIPAAK